LWKCERTGEEYNTLDLVKDNTKTKQKFLVFLPSPLKCKREAIMYYSSPGAL
jgi:hypothetical protein